MIELSDKQRTQGVFRLSTFAPFFQARQENARNLHEVLRSSWQCCCNASHKVMLQLERKVDRGEDEFNMLCVVPPNDPQDQPQVRFLSISFESCLVSWGLKRLRVPLAGQSALADSNLPGLHPSKFGLEKLSHLNFVRYLLIS